MIAPRKTPKSGMPGVLVEGVLVGVADRLQQVVGLLGSEAADDGARHVVRDRDEQAGAGDRDSGEDERHRQVAERGADEQADVLADDRLDHREHQHQERERARDGDHGAVLALEPARREIGAASCFSMSSPTLPVTQTAAFVTQAVTPRMTNSPASAATLVTAPATASQTLPTTGRSHGLGPRVRRLLQKRPVRTASGTLPFGADVDRELLAPTSSACTSPPKADLGR